MANGGERASEIQTEIDNKEDQEKSDKESLAVLEGELATLTEERDSVAEELRQHAGAAALQKERDRVAGELADARSQRDLAVTERAALVATRGFLAFTDELAAGIAEKAAALYRMVRRRSTVRFRKRAPGHEDYSNIYPVTLGVSRALRGHFPAGREAATWADVSSQDMRVPPRPESSAVQLRWPSA